MMTGTCGLTRSESSGKWDRDSQSWRTSQASLWEVMDGHHMGAPWSDSWPKSGMTRNGELYPLPMLERLISATGGGSWPTPTTEDAGRNGSAEDWRKYEKEGQTSGARLRNAAKMTDEDEESWLARHAAGKVATPPLALAARMLPTPPLALAARMLPTPTSRDHKDGDAHSCQNVPVNGLLGREVHMLPTPSSGGDSGGPHGIRGGSWAKEKLVETFGEEQAVAMSGGSLSPNWTSWLMGLPVGWTSLEPLSQEDYDEWFQAQLDGTWWQEERGLPRIATGIPDRVNRLKCLGNGIVPASLALFLRGTQ